jgi:hypothetical protein
MAGGILKPIARSGEKCYASGTGKFPIGAKTGGNTHAKNNVDADSVLDCGL